MAPGGRAGEVEQTDPEETMFLLLCALACADKTPDDSDAGGDTGATADDTGGGGDDTGVGGDSAEYWLTRYQGLDLVTAAVTRTEGDDGGLTLEGTTAYDYTAYFPFTATISERVTLDAGGRLKTAEVHSVATVGATDYRERFDLDVDARSATVTRPAGTWEWDLELEEPVIYWSIASDLLFAFNMGTPISAEVLAKAGALSDDVWWVSHDYGDVFAFEGSGDATYYMGDTVETDGEGGVLTHTLRDLGLPLARTDEALALTPVSVEHGEAPIEPEDDCGLSGEERTFTVTSLDGTAIAGTSHWPDGFDLSGEVIVFNAGTGGSDRDERVGGLDRWRCLANPFLDAGVAVVRYDDRGHGESGGDFDEMTFQARTEDALAVAEWASGQEGVQRLFLLGHSEGVAHVSEVAAMADFEVTALLLFAGVGDYSGLDIWLRQTELYMEEHGFERTIIDQQIDAMSDDADQILSGTYSRDTYGYYPVEFWEDFFAFNGADLALEAGLPVYIAQGERDWQVPVDNGRSLADALTAGGLDVSYFETSDGGHFLSRAPDDFPMSGDEYFLPIGWDAELLEGAVSFVLEL